MYKVPHVRNLRHTVAGAVRSVAHRADQRLVLRAAQPRAGGDLRHAQHHQLRPRRPVHDGRLHGLFPAALFRLELLVGAGDRAVHGRRLRRRHRAPVPAAAVQARPSLRPAADLRSGADHRGPVPQQFRLVRPAVPGAGRAAGRPESRLHVPAQLPRLGDRRLADGLHQHLVSSSSARGSAPICAPPPKIRRWCAPSASTCRA